METDLWEVRTRSTIGGRNDGKEPYEDEHHEDDVALWGHGYP